MVDIPCCIGFGLNTLGEGTNPSWSAESGARSGHFQFTTD
jgi:hypothetical protein